MNMINDKHNVAFGLKFTPRAQELLEKEVKQLEIYKWIDFGGENRISKPLETIKYFANHKKSHDLTIDIFETGKKDRPYEYSFSFTKGSQVKRSLKEPSSALSLGSLIESIKKPELESVKKKLKAQYTDFKNVQANIKELKKISRDKGLKARFAEGTSKYIPELEMQASDFNLLMQNTPERFTFKLAKNKENKFDFLVASSDYPKAGFKEYEAKYSPFGEDERISTSTHISDFEQGTLKNAHDEIIRLDEAKAVFKTALEQKKGLQFTNEAKKILLGTEEISPEQVAEFTQLAQRESSKNLVLNIFARHDNPNAYDSALTGEDRGTIGCFGYGFPLKQSIKRILEHTKDIESFEKKLIQKNLTLKIKQEKDTAIKNLMQTQAFKDKFVEDSAQNIEANFDALGLSSSHLKTLVEETPGLKIKVGEKNDGRVPILVASDKYSQAGFVQIHEYTLPYAINNLTPVIIKTFEESTLKPTHFENIKIDKARKQLKNIFARAEKNSK